MAYINGHEIIFSPIVNITKTEGAKSYDASAVYKSGQIVLYNGSFYAAKFDNVSGKLPTDTECWENLNETITNLNEIRKAILGRGGEIDTNASLDDCPDAIFNIPADTSLASIEDSTSAYRKIVPSKAEEYALVKKIGGMSYKTKNILPISKETSQTFAGITYTNNQDGSWTLNGTATERSYKYLVLGLTIPNTVYTFSGAITDKCAINIDLLKNGSYVNAFVDNGSGTPIYTGDYESVDLSIYIVVNAGVTVSNLVVKPMLNNGETALPYEPYFEGLRDTKVTSLESIGKNLYYGEQEIKCYNGMPYVTIFEKEITAPVRLNFDINGTIGNSGGSIFKTTHLDGTISYTYWNTSLKDVKKIELVNWAQVEGTITNIQLEYGTEATEFSSFKGTLDTFPIPEEIFNREDWGCGLDNTYYNYIEWRNGRYYFIQTCKKLIFDGTENWDLTTADKYFVLYGNYLPAPPKANMGICSHFSYGKSDGQFFVGSGMGFYKSDYTTVADWKSYLAELYASGNPLVVEYALAEPIETDITDLITRSKFLKVEGGGTIITHSEYEQNAPSTIKFTTKVG